MLANYMKASYDRAMELNDQNVARALREFGPFESLLDVGCWDGVKTLEYGRAAAAGRLFGIEVVAEKAAEARDLGIQVSSLRADADRWPFDDGSLDCVVTNQVIEHLSDVDYFASEAARALRPGGIMVTSTNNLSSWHNIFALLFGWAPFDLTNSSSHALGIGNPIAAHRGEPSANGASWCHKCVYTTAWLNDWFSLHGLAATGHYGAGYYPFPASVGSVLKRHCAFITVVSRRKL